MDRQGGSGNVSPARSGSPYGSPIRSTNQSMEFRIRRGGDATSPFDADAEPWGPKDIGRNAISGVMNDKQPPKSMENFAPVPPTIIRKVRNTEFDPYTKYLSEVFDKYQYHRAIGLQSAMEGTPTLGTSPLDEAEYLDLLDAASQLSLLPDTGGKRGRAALTASQRTRMLSVNAPPLDIVPKVFFELDFNLQAPHTFDAVTGGDDKVTSENPAETHVASSALQEKFSYLLDTVEVHLLKEIARKSSSFFAALSNLQALHSETLSCVEQIAQLRGKLHSVKQTGARRGIEVTRLKRRRANMAVLYASVRIVRDVQQMQPTIQALLAQSDFMTALNLVESTSLALRGSSDSGVHLQTDANSPVVAVSPSSSAPETIAPGIILIKSSAIPCTVDLRGVKGLAQLAHHLSEVSRNIGIMMESEFVRILLDKTTFEIVKSPTGGNGGPAVQYISNILEQKFLPGINPPATIEITDVMLEKEGRLRDRLDRLVLGLLRMDRLGSAFSVYRDNLLLEIKALAKKHHPPIGALDPSIPESAIKREQQQALAKQLKGMTFDAFLDVMLNVYIALLTSLERVAISNALICRIIKRAQDTGVQIGADSHQSLQLPPLPGSDESATSASSHPSHAALLRKRIEDDDDEFGSSADVLSPASLDAVSKLSTVAVIDKPVTVSSDTKGSDKTATTYGQMLNESAEILYSGSDLAQVRCAKLLSVRAEQNAQLNPKDFYRLFGATWEFVAGCEALCGRLCLGLKGNMLSQAKAYLNHFHEERTKQITLLVENEQWTQADVPIDFQRITDQIIAARSFGSPPPERPIRGGGQQPNTISSLTSLPLKRSSTDDNNNMRGSTSIASLHNALDDDDERGSSASPAKGSKSMKYVVVNGHKYYMVGCMLMFLKQLTEYMQCMENVPVLTAEVLNRIMEILKLVNNRLCQVILGAGAMRSAGLKNITARHIALAAQSLGVIVVLIPYLRVGIQQYLPTKQAVLLNDMDRLVKDYRDHQSELYAKLVSIMMERLTVHSKNLQGVNWDSPDPKDFLEEDGGVSTHMVTLVKETMTLHKVLAKYLDPETLKSVMGDVFKAYIKKLEEDLKKLDLFTSAGKNRLLIDVQYFIFKLSSLDGADGPGNHLEVVVNNTKIKDRRQVQPRPVSMSMESPVTPSGPATSTNATTIHPALPAAAPIPPPQPAVSTSSTGATPSVAAATGLSFKGFQGWKAAVPVSSALPVITSDTGSVKSPTNSNNASPSTSSPNAPGPQSNVPIVPSPQPLGASSTTNSSSSLNLTGPSITTPTPSTNLPPPLTQISNPQQQQPSIDKPVASTTSTAGSAAASAAASWTVKSSHFRTAFGGMFTARAVTPTPGQQKSSESLAPPHPPTKSVSDVTPSTIPAVNSSDGRSSLDGRSSVASVEATRSVSVGLPTSKSSESVGVVPATAAIVNLLQVVAPEVVIPQPVVEGQNSVVSPTAEGKPDVPSKEAVVSGSGEAENVARKEEVSSVAVESENVSGKEVMPAVPVQAGNVESTSGMPSDEKVPVVIDSTESAAVKEHAPEIVAELNIPVVENQPSANDMVAENSNSGDSEALDHNGGSSKPLEKVVGLSEGTDAIEKPISDSTTVLNVEEVSDHVEPVVSQVDGENAEQVLTADGPKAATGTSVQDTTGEVQQPQENSETPSDVTAAEKGEEEPSESL
ncbi:hypothetical protein SmJEL517_g00015 [Synchytrium microbalum]|uniref:Vacuolar protein sorting-associated protein 54 n=1 Tax=Synchytrium microbalum TaxID=1806994 RepID=A0A507CIZ8_9FUNG|nr:uncharacterized protein SmJEL517_g00015 [Synchytrium microbalum]TPX38226.1 hypothetical protein SmJEL517_g00015 [Synchytrium microbalum]